MILEYLLNTCLTATIVKTSKNWLDEWYLISVNYNDRGLQRSIMCYRFIIEAEKGKLFIASKCSNSSISRNFDLSRMSFIEMLFCSMCIAIFADKSYRSFDAILRFFLVEKWGGCQIMLTQMLISFNIMFNYIEY